MGLLLLTLEIWNKNLAQIPKPNVYIHKKALRGKIFDFSEFSLFFPGVVSEIKLCPLSTTRTNIFWVFHLWDFWGNICSSATMLTEKLVTNFFGKTSKNWFFYLKNDVLKPRMLCFGFQRVHYPQRWLKIYQFLIFTPFHTIKWLLLVPGKPL